MIQGREKWMLRVWVLILLFSLLYLLLFPKIASQATVDGLRLSVRTVVPAVFPYLVLSGMFVSSGLADRLGGRLHTITERIFGLPGCCAGAILLGILCGFPTGSRMAGMLYTRGSITKDEAARLMAFADFCGPPYIITVLGTGILHSVKIGFVIFAVQTVLSLFFGMLLGIGKQRHVLPTTAAVKIHPMQAFTDSVKSATVGTLHICGYVTFFAVIMSAASPLLEGIPEDAAALFYGFFEMSGGIARLTESDHPLISGSVIVLWSGLSVLAQVYSSAGEGDDALPMRPYLIVRMVMVPIGTAIVYFICRILGLIV